MMPILPTVQPHNLSVAPISSVTEIMVQGPNAAYNDMARQRRGFIELISLQYGPTLRFQQYTHVFIHALGLDPAIPVGCWEEQDALNLKLTSFLEKKRVLPHSIRFAYFDDDAACEAIKLVYSIRPGARKIYLANGRLNADQLFYVMGRDQRIPDVHKSYGVVLNEKGGIQKRISEQPSRPASQVLSTAGLSR